MRKITEIGYTARFNTLFHRGKPLPLVGVFPLLAARLARLLLACSAVGKTKGVSPLLAAQVHRAGVLRRHSPGTATNFVLFTW